MLQLPELELLMETPASRLQYLMDEENLNQTELAEKIDRSRGLISSYLNPENNPSAIFLRELEDRLGWSSRWIRTGDGPERVNAPLPNTKSKKNEAVKIDFIDETDVTISKHGMEFRDLDNGMVLMTMPFVDEFAYASYPHGWKDPEYVIELPRYSIVLPKREAGFYRAFEVRGDSMNDGTINSISYGDVAVGRLIEPDYWHQKLYVDSGTDYIIVTHDGIICKKITKHDLKSATITCSSNNPDKKEYPDYEVRLSEVYELYKIRKVDRDWSRR